VALAHFEAGLTTITRLYFFTGHTEEFNIGAIIRTAHSFLVREILLIGDTPYYERASMGMEKYENITEIPTEQHFVKLAHTRGWKLVVFGSSSMPATYR